MIDTLVYVSCKFEMYIFKIAQVINENVRISFLYVLSIYHGYKIDYFQMKNCNIFLIFAQNIDLGYTLGLPH